MERSGIQKSGRGRKRSPKPLFAEESFLALLIALVACIFIAISSDD